MTDPERSARRAAILQRAADRKPMVKVDNQAVIDVIRLGLLVVTDTYDRTEVCPYRLTDAGREALAAYNDKVRRANR